MTQFDDAHLSIALADQEYSWRWRWLVRVRAPWGEFDAFLQTDAQVGGISRIMPQLQSDRDAMSGDKSLQVDVFSRAGTGSRWSARGRIDGMDLWMPIGFAIRLDDIVFERPSRGLATLRCGSSDATS